MTCRISICTLAGAAALLVGLAAHAEPAMYRITDTITGSMVPQDIILSPLPFDRTYAHLTPGQKAVLASNYESLATGDEPPYPLLGLRHMIEPVVRFADLAAPVGPLLASVMVDAEGKAGAVTVYRSPSPEMTRLVAGALSLERYKPAVCGGRPCKMEFVLRLDFPQRGASPVSAVTPKSLGPSTHSLSGD